MFTDEFDDLIISSKLLINNLLFSEITLVDETNKHPFPHLLFIIYRLVILI